MSGFDRRQWRSDLKTCINQIAKNFKQAIKPQSSQIQQTPLIRYNRRITDDWVMEAKEALGLWEGEPLSVCLETKEEYENVRQALEGKATAIVGALSADPQFIPSWRDYPAVILGHIMTNNLAGIPPSRWHDGVEDELKRLGSMGRERKGKLDGEIRARTEKARREEEQSRNRAAQRNEAFRRRHPLPEQSSQSSAAALLSGEQLRLKGLLKKEISKIVNTCSRANVNEETVAKWKNEVYEIFGIGEELHLNECIRNEEVIITMKTLLFKPFEANIWKDGLSAFEAPLNQPECWLQYMQRFKPSNSSSNKKRAHSPGRREDNEQYPKVFATSSRSRRR
ncbi:hypothetical protein JCM5350_002702 [Sporobolomyces pararoseus]